MILNKILQGDCLELLPTLPEDSIDAIVTDPPYELTSGNSKKGFMGKAWDGSGIAYNVGMWAECLRVLKPGGHMLAFGGDRTHHRMFCAIEDAGFEIRHTVVWTYGSGFPKSLDISKQIDRHGGKSVGWFGPWLRQWREENGITQKDIAALFPSKTGNLTGCVANWELNLNMPTCEQFNLICKTYKLPFNSLEEAEREVIGKNPNGFGPNGGASLTHNLAAHPDITAPATPAAQTWAGWGSALKPAAEFICLARKPLAESTIASNVLRWGTGALNVDGCRISPINDEPNAREHKGTSMGYHGGIKENAPWRGQTGRFPANLIHSGDECILAEFAKAGSSITGNRSKRSQEAEVKGTNWLSNNHKSKEYPGESGSPARFFQACPFTEEDIPAFLYYAKASRAEREAGLDGMPILAAKNHTTGNNGEGDHRTIGRATTLEKSPLRMAKNSHPTIKPLSLMRYLCRLITPPGGLILDPFAGSGTTCMAAKAEGFHYMGIEREAEYCDIARKRISAIPEPLTTFQ